jgi:hypothetical protein
MNSAWLLAILLGAARPALACGACVDAGLQARWWWAPAILMLAGVLLLEVPVTALVWRALGRRPQTRRRGAVLLAAVAGVGLSMLLGGSGAALGLGVTLVLAPTLARSLLRELGGSRRAAAIRIAGVALACVTLAVPLMPSQRSTSALIGLASSISARPAPDSWVLAELRRRADADPELDARIGRATFGERARLLTLHGKVAEAAHHRALCDLQRAAAASDGERQVVDTACAAP